MKKLRDKSNKNRNHAVDLRIGNSKSTFDGIIVKAFGDMKPKENAEQIYRDNTVWIRLRLDIKYRNKKNSPDCCRGNPY